MMTPEQEKMCASFVLRLLLEDDSANHKPEQVAWEDLLEIAQRNTVLVRLFQEFQRRGISTPTFFSARVEEQRRLNQNKFDLIQRINRSCEEKGIGFIFAKTFHHYPDMGGDIDLFVLNESCEIDAVILKGLSFEPSKRSLTDRLASARSYKVHDYDAMLDIHHGRMWAYGEHQTFIATLIKNARRIELEGMEFSTPTAEDQLIMQATQRVYGRKHIRLAHVLYTISLLRNDKLDWDYVLSTATRFNAFPGLSCYLSYVNQIHRQVFAADLLPVYVKKALVTQDWGTVEFKNGSYRFPHLRVARKVYSSMFRGALLSGNWKSLSRLCLAPFAAATAVLRKSVS